MRTGRKTP